MVTVEELECLEQQQQQLTSHSLSPSSSSTEEELPHAERLRRAKDSVYAFMASLRYMGSDGRQVLNQDELVISGRNEVRLRDNDAPQDLTSLAYWQSKEQFFGEHYNRLYRVKYPRPPELVRTDSPQQAEQDMFDQCVRDLEKRQKTVAAWLQESAPLPAPAPAPIPPSRTPRSTADPKRKRNDEEGDMHKQPAKRLRPTSPTAPAGVKDKDHMQGPHSGSQVESRKLRRSVRIAQMRERNRGTARSGP